MFADAARGLVAGALGTTALNLVTYLDVTIRGRPTSDVPAKTAGRMADAVGVDLGADREEADNRRAGLGALLGYVTGLGIGATYGLVRQRLPGPAVPIAAVAAGAAAMAASDVSATAAGATDPRRWDAASWVADVVPHLVYGAVTAAAFERLTPSR